MPRRGDGEHGCTIRGCDLEFLADALDDRGFSDTADTMRNVFWAESDGVPRALRAAPLEYLASRFEDIAAWSRDPYWVGKPVVFVVSEDAKTDGFYNVTAPGDTPEWFDPVHVTYWKSDSSLFAPGEPIAKKPVQNMFDDVAASHTFFMSARRARGSFEYEDDGTRQTIVDEGGEREVMLAIGNDGLYEFFAVGPGFVDEDGVLWPDGAWRRRRASSGQFVFGVEDGKCIKNTNPAQAVVGVGYFGYSSGTGISEGEYRTSFSCDISGDETTIGLSSLYGAIGSVILKMGIDESRGVSGLPAGETMRVSVGVSETFIQGKVDEATRLDI